MPKPLRLMFYYWTLSPGGVQHMMSELAAALVERGHHVEFVIATDKGENDILMPAGVEVRHLNCGTSGKAVLPLAQYIRQKKPDVIYTGMPTMNITAVLANRLAGSPARVVISERSNPALEFAAAPTWRYRLAAKLQPSVYRMADAIVAVSEELADDLSAFSQIDREMIQVIYNPSWHPKALGNPPPHPWLRPGEPPVVIGAGRLVPQKDFGFFLEAFARLRKLTPARAIILGNGPMQQDLQVHALRLRISEDVHFAGYVPDVIPWFENSAVFALTSRWEGFGNVIVQALGAGCNVVSIRCRSGPAEILADGTYGKLVEPGDPDGFASRLLEQLQNPFNRHILQERANYFSLERSADRYEKLFQELVDS